MVTLPKGAKILSMPTLPAGARIVGMEQTSIPSPAGYQESQRGGFIEGLKSIGRGAVKGPTLGIVDLPGEEDPTTEFIAGVAPYILAAMGTSGGSLGRLAVPGLKQIPAIAKLGAALGGTKLAPEAVKALPWAQKALYTGRQLLPGAIEAAAPMAAVGALKPAETIPDRLRQAGTEGLIGAGFNLAGKAALPVASRLFGTTTGLGKEKTGKIITEAFSPEKSKTLASLSVKGTQQEFGAVAEKAQKATAHFAKRASRYISKSKAGMGNINVAADDVLGLADDVERTLGIQPEFIGRTKGQIKSVSEAVAKETKMGVDQLKEHAARRIETAINAPKMLRPFKTRAALGIADKIDDAIIVLEKSGKATDLLKLPQRDRDILRMFSSDFRQLSQSGNLNGKTAYELRNTMDDLIRFQKEGGISQTAKDILYNARTKINEQLTTQYKEFGGAMLESSDLLSLFEKMGATPKTIAGFERTLKSYNNLPGETKQYLSTLDMKLPEAQQFLAKTLNVNAQRDLVSQANPALKVARELRSQITEGKINLKEADRVLQMINKDIDSPAIDETTRSSLNILRRQLQTKITKNAPAYVRATKNLEEVAALLAELKSAPATEGGFQKLLQEWDKQPEAIKRTLMEIDKNTPQGKKFLEDTLGLNLRKDWMAWVPEEGAAKIFGLGSGIGVGLLARGVTGNPAMLAAAIPFTATASPRLALNAIRLGATGTGVAKKLGLAGKGRYLLGSALTGTSGEENK